MRLLTYSSLKCPAKDVANGYPLQLKIEEMKIEESDCDFDFLKSILPTLDWEAVVIAANCVRLQDFPTSLHAELLEDESFLRAMHNLLLDVHVIKGTLTCPESGRKFLIKKSVPCML